MSFRSRRYVSPDKGRIHPLIQLWLLRLLIPLQCHRKFLGDRDLENEELAELFDLSTGDTETYDPINLRTRLKQLHHQAEKQAAAIMLPEPLGSNIQQLSTIGFSQAECWSLAFAVCMRSSRLLDDASDWLGCEINSLTVYHVLAILLGFPESEIRDALSSRSLLSKTGLVVLDHQRNSLSRKLDLLSRNFADRLMVESGSPLDWLRDMIIASPAPVLRLADYPHMRESLELILPYLQQSVSYRRKGVNIFLYGIPGTGKTQLTRVLAEHLQCPLFEIACEDDDGDPVSGEQRLRAYRAAQAFFQKRACLMVFDEVEDVFNDGNTLFGSKSTAQIRKAWMNRLLEENQVPTLWLGNTIDSIDPAFIRRFDWVIEVPVPPKAQRERIIRDHCASVLTEHSIQRLAACQELAPAVVSRAAQVIGTLRDQFPVEQLSTAMQDMMDKTLIAQGHPGLNQDEALRLPDYYDPELINSDTDLIQIIEGIRRHGSAHLCLFGPPGTGKTAYSRWLAEQLEKPLHVKRGAELLSKWVGGTEKNISRVFKEANEDHAVLLIDEVDSFLQDRNSSQHSWEVTAVNEMLTRMETYNGVLIASTNRLESLDTAALRRFDLKVKFDALKPEQAWTLLARLCATLGLPDPENRYKKAIEQLEGLTPGDFSVLVRQNRFKPLADIDALISALKAECQLKTPYQRLPIGFIH